MIKLLWLLIVCLGACNFTSAQTLDFPAAAANDDAALATAIPSLAKQVIAQYKEEDRAKYLANLFRLQMVAGDYTASNASINSLRELLRDKNPNYAGVTYIQYEIFSAAKLMRSARNVPFEDAFKEAFRAVYGKLSDKEAYRASGYFFYDLGQAQKDLQGSLDKLKGKDNVQLSDALELIGRYQPYEVYKSIASLSEALQLEDDDRRYIIEDNVPIKTKDGATLSAIVVRKRGVTTPRPTAMLFTIYADTARNFGSPKFAAANGYVGVVAFSRGKAASPDEITPYEYEAQDTYSAIDWISKQPWSNGQVGMYGGSYSGFTSWAATKYMHPALKTIVPYVAGIPGQGLPMENNVFLSVNYGWAFYVTNNKYVDNQIYSDPQRWQDINNKWFASGKPYRQLDSFDKMPNKLLQRWLQHPSFDKYWQSMVPYKEDFSHVNIPVLTITGYYDDGQICAIQYLKDHYKYNKNANHYLVIGPYDHFGAQRSHKDEILNGYAIDPVAQLDTPEITFQWLDYIMRDGKKPALLEDKINYEVMGANIWRHAPSLEKMSNETLTLYLADTKSGNYYQLAKEKPAKPGFLEQTVDLADRKTENNNDYYPSPIIEKTLGTSTGLSFISEPFNEPISVNGGFSGELKASINKKDMDIGVALFEVMPNGELFHLSYYLGRASYVRDISVRSLLTPGKVEAIPFDRTRVVSRQLSKGSRLLVVIDINKNAFAQVNYGTGKDVSDEDISDAKEPLQIKWFSDSYVKIPIWK